MNWINLEHLLRPLDAPRLVTHAPALDHAELCRQALCLAGGLRQRGIRRLAVHLEDAASLAIALLGAWRAGVEVLLPADLQPATRERWHTQVDLWLTTDEQLDDLLGEALAPADLDVDTCRISLCTSGSSGEPKRIDKQLRQLANEVNALEQLWGQDLGNAWIIGSVATQHIYGLLFRVLWPLCAGRGFERRQLPFPEDLQRASREHAAFAWVASPALLKRMGDNLDWPALSPVRRMFSSGGELPSIAAERLHQRLGQWPTEILGSSETGGIAWRQGQPLWQPFADVRLSQDEHGALRIASPYLPAGHIEQSADAAEFSDDGRFRLLGRLDRIVKLEEKRISLPMLEQALCAHAWVAEARLGVIEEGRAYLGALVALTPAGLHALRNQGRRAVVDGLRQHLAGHCEALALPRRWRLARQLPLNPQGKLPHAELQALLLAPRSMAPEVLGHRQAGEELHLRLAVPLDLACFSGHFPQTPVLPGVVQLDWAIALAASHLQLAQRFAGMEVLKFQQLVRPGDELLLTLRFDATRGKLYFVYTCAGQPCSSGRIVLETAHA
ncbi:acyl-CoA synthetase family protein [Pseudomonas entomophila]|uniref:AMP-binding protein n=2 Tax=Pseudomonas entomophila TaxID=312306 RepID=A0ABY9QRW7_9PSED|nr:acyl-CoA synthetase family protein [Pseudomonas entomophila]WMW05835.1 AMP-binding protein [Pseudomonas entomophila]CAK13319.1 putative AMP-binding enzyme [Pseudomonas entomophila L48]